MRHHTRLTLAAATMIAIAVAGGSPALAQAQQPATPAPPTTPSPGTTPAPATSMPNQMQHGRAMGTGMGTGTGTEDNKMPMMGGQGHPGSMMGGMGGQGQTAPMGAMPPCPAGQIASGTPPTCK